MKHKYPTNTLENSEPHVINLHHRKGHMIITCLSVFKNLSVNMHARWATVLVIIPMKGDYTSQRPITTRALQVCCCNPLSILSRCRSYSPLSSSCPLFPFFSLPPLQLLLIKDWKVIPTVNWIVSVARELILFFFFIAHLNIIHVIWVMLRYSESMIEGPQHKLAKD